MGAVACGKKQPGSAGTSAMMAMFQNDPDLNVQDPDSIMKTFVEE